MSCLDASETDSYGHASADSYALGPSLADCYALGPTLADCYALGTASADRYALGPASVSHSGLSDQRFHQGVSEQRFDQGVSDRRFDQGMSDGLFDQGVSDGLFDQGVGEQRFDQGVSDGRFDQGGSDQLFDQLIWKSGRRPEADLNADWLGEPLFPARSWLRNHARDSALAIASCQPEYPTQAHTSNATPHFGSPAWPYSGAGTPNSEPDSNEPIAVPVRAVSQDGVIFFAMLLVAEL